MNRATQHNTSLNHPPPRERNGHSFACAAESYRKAA
jgi:hypothetical protein